MQTYEVNTIIENIPYLDRNLWEQTRFLAYVNVQINSKKQYNPTDILKFAWDTELNKEIHNSDIERLREKSKQISLSLQNGK